MSGFAHAARKIDSYLVCATPRTGSSLLCGLLESSGVMGHPESYFRQQDEQSWLTEWGLARSPEGTFDYAQFVQAALVAGRTENGVFAARIMWGTLDELVEKLGTVFPDLAGQDLDLLTGAFGPLRFVYLRRRDVLAQAASWLRAEQTNVWHRTEHGPPEEPAQAPWFDLDRIQSLIQLIGTHNSAWKEWFAKVGVRPHDVTYEDLDADPVGVTRGVLDHLSIDLPPGARIVARHVRLADDLSARWVARFHAEVTQAPRPSGRRPPDRLR